MSYLRSQFNVNFASLIAVLMLLMVGYFFTANSVLAQAADGSGYDKSGKSGLVQCGNKSSDPCTVEDAFNLFVIGTNILVGLVGLIAIFAIVFSGYNMIIAAGNTEAVTKAKKSLTNAIIGVVLVLLAFILINTILYATLGVTGNKGGVFKPLEYIGLGGSGGGTGQTNSPTNSPIK